LLVFGTVFTKHILKHRPKPSDIIAPLITALIFLYPLGYLTLLLVECVMGDCP
jgi:hypothetical protein